MLQIVTLASALVGMVTGIGGLVLGIVNYRNQLRASAAKLRVIPKHAFPGPMDEMVSITYFSEVVEDALNRLKTYACIEITNLSPKPQTIFEVGFVAEDGRRIPWRDPDDIEPGDSFPMVLAPDETGATYLRIFPAQKTDVHAIAYARNDCGEQFNGTSPIMDDFVLRVNHNTKA